MGVKFQVTGDSPEDIQRCLQCKRSTCVDCLSHGAATSRRSQSVAVKQIDPTTGQTVAVFKSLTEAMEKTGVSRTQISRCLHKKTKTAGDYYWEVAV